MLCFDTVRCLLCSPNKEEADSAPDCVVFNGVLKCLADYSTVQLMSARSLL